MKSGGVDEAIPLMARDGGLSLAVLQGDKPFPDGLNQLSGSGSWIPLRTLGVNELWRCKVKSD